MTGLDGYDQLQRSMEVRRLELRQLQIFCTAAETLNFTRAGVQLGYAQSNITGQIRQLEEELQVKLFERLGRGIQLTNEGRNFLGNARRILALCKRAKEECANAVFQGTLTIGAAESLCVYRLPQLLSAYRKLYPLVDIRVQTESCERLQEMVKANQVDMAMVLTDRVRSPDMAVQTLHEESMTVVASPLHPLAGRKQIAPRDLAGACLILTLPGCGYRPLICALFKEHGVALGPIMDLSSVNAIKQCTMCGLGVTILPRIALAQELREGRLVELTWAGPPFEVKTQLFYHKEKWLTAAMKAFLALCRPAAG